MKVFSFKNIRIFFLLLLLAYAAIYTKQQSLTIKYWHKPVSVVLYPINGDDTPETQRFIDELNELSLSELNQFFSKQAEQYNLITETPFEFTIGKPIQTLPPVPPANKQDTLSVVIWSLKLRYWAYQTASDNADNAQRIRLYVLYHQPEENKALAHSLGLQKGLLGIVHAYGIKEQNSQNAIVIAHELMHTLGASDKYNQNNYPIYPHGFAEPDRSPLFPQRYTELMSGRMAINEHEAVMPDSLKHVMINQLTATEVNWIKNDDNH